MNDQRTIGGTFWAMIAIQTLGGLDLPGKGPRKLPAPARYVAATVLWGIFHLTASIVPRLARAVAAMSVAVVVTTMFVGPAGQTVVSFIGGVARRFGAPATAGEPATAAPAESQTLTPVPA